MRTQINHVKTIFNKFSLFPAERLRFALIGTTDVSPVEAEPTEDNIDVCAISNSLLAAGETKAFQCGNTGRYLAVVQENKQYLTVCEVQVFAGTIVVPSHLKNNAVISFFPHAQNGNRK